MALGSEGTFGITATMKTGTVTLTGFEEIAQWMDEQHAQFAAGAQKVHRKTVLQTLIYWIRVCPVLTGRLRGSLTLYLDRWSKQAAYQKYLRDKSLVTGGAEGKNIRKGSLEDQFDEGKKDGVAIESNGGMMTTVGTNVIYAEYVDRKTQHFEKTMIKAVDLYERNFQNYLDAAHAAGWIPKAEDVPDDPDSGAGVEE